MRYLHTADHLYLCLTTTRGSTPLEAPSGVVFWMCLGGKPTEGRGPGVPCTIRWERSRSCDLVCRSCPQRPSGTLAPSAKPPSWPRRPLGAWHTKSYLPDRPRRVHGGAPGPRYDLDAPGWRSPVDLGDRVPRAAGLLLKIKSLMVWRA